MKKPHKSGAPAARDWRGWLRYNRDYAKDLLRKDGKIHGAIFTFHHRKNVDIHVVGFRDAEHKTLVYRFLALKSVALDAEAVGVMTEAWVLEPQALPGESPEAMRERTMAGIKPSQSERRIETASTTLIYRDDANHLQAYAALDEILRDGEAKITGFRGLMSEADVAKPSPVDPRDGYFADLLQADPPTPAQVAGVRQRLEQIAPTIMAHLGIH